MMPINILENTEKQLKENKWSAMKPFCCLAHSQKSAVSYMQY